MKHTPNKWNVSSTFLVVSEEGKIIADCLTAGLPPALAVPPEEAEANARLIASAPTLLEALQELQKYSGFPAGSYQHGLIINAIKQATE